MTEMSTKKASQIVHKIHTQLHQQISCSQIAFKIHVEAKNLLRSHSLPITRLSLRVHVMNTAGCAIFEATKLIFVIWDRDKLQVAKHSKFRKLI